MTTPAATWTPDELATFGTTDEIQLAVTRADGTLRRPVTIWLVRAGDDLFVRSVNGSSATWYRPVAERHEGRLDAAGFSREVALEAAGSAVDDEVDAAYRSKYGQYPRNYVDAIVTPQARETTLRLLPR
jgi:hypothetical protein